MTNEIEIEGGRYPGYAVDVVVAVIGVVVTFSRSLNLDFKKARLRDL